MLRRRDRASPAGRCRPPCACTDPAPIPGPRPGSPAAPAGRPARPARRIRTDRRGISGVPCVRRLLGCSSTAHSKQCRQAHLRNSPPQTPHDGIRLGFPRSPRRSPVCGSALDPERGAEANPLPCSATFWIAGPAWVLLIWHDAPGVWSQVGRSTRSGRWMLSVGTSRYTASRSPGSAGRQWCSSSGALTVKTSNIRGRRPPPRRWPRHLAVRRSTARRRRETCSR